jgi:hypothetical protein
LKSFQAVQNEKSAATYSDDARRRLISLYESWNRPEAAAQYRVVPPTTAVKPE